MDGSSKESKRDIENRAKNLIDTSPAEALSLYRGLYSDYAPEFNGWDAVFTLKCLRKVPDPHLDFAFELAEKFNEGEIVANLLGWLVFDSCVKGKKGASLIQAEDWIIRLASVAPQKDLRNDSKYPCPVTISLLNLADAYAENNLNARKVADALSHIDPAKLSDTPETITTEERGETSLASQLERYYALITKAMQKLGLFDQCLELCNEALRGIKKFHYDNDLWFKMRAAICKHQLGRVEESKRMFNELLATRKGGGMWFLYRDLADLYFDQKLYNEAWEYSVNAALMGNEPHFMINLYLLQAKILYKLQRPGDGKILAELIGSILNEQGWKTKTEFSRLFKYYEINLQNLSDKNEHYRKAVQFWQSERYKGKEAVKGTIVSIHSNGKVGRIKTGNGNIIAFHRKDFVKKQLDLAALKGSTVEFYEMEGFDGKTSAEGIRIIESAKNRSQANTVITNKVNSDIVNKEFTGRIQNIVEFGIFVTVPGQQNGLLHKSNLPPDLQNIFKTHFTVGEPIEIVVSEITAKGLALKLQDHKS